MPKKKSKNKSRRNNKKPANGGEETSHVEVTATPVIITTDVDSNDQANIELDESQVKSLHHTEPVVEEDGSNTEEHLDSNCKETSTIAITPEKKKKRSSFLNNLLHSSGNKDMDKAKSNGSTVKRSQSVSAIGKEEETPKSKIPTHKFRHSKKRALTASCSNVESTSLVLNPGMDSWRMEGLLDTVEKSNSIHALNINTEQRSHKSDEPNVSLTSPMLKLNTSPEEPEEMEMKEQPKVDPKIDGEIESTPNVTAAPEIQVKVGEKEVAQDFVETNIDFEYSAEIHDEKNKANEETSQVGPGVMHEPVPKPEDLSVNTISEIGNTVVPGSPVMKDAVTDEEMYELENNSVVTIRHLNDVLRENQIQLPEEISPNDWLVLNLSSPPVIESF